MSSRFAAWLCLIGAAACSHENSRPAAGAEDVSQSSVASTDPAMTPASLETNRPTTSDASSPSGSAPLAPTTGTTGTTGTSGSDARAPMTGASSDQRSGTSESKTSGATTPPRAVEPDNTKVNERDTNQAAPTPGDQRENESDLKITQNVRKAVMADGSLSFTAKNVKIITQNGKVTLRGPVKTAEERAAIESAARKIAGVNQVDNQIEVKK